MARFSRALANRPVNSMKHVIDAQSTAIGTTQVVVDLVDAQDNPVTGTISAVHIGAHVRAIWLKIDAITVVGGLATDRPSLYMYVIKNPSNELNLANIPADQVGVSQRRKFVIHQEMIMLSKDSADNFPRTLMSGVVLIPKKYQRMGVDDKLQVVVQWNSSISVTFEADICLQSIYKEFY